MCRLKAVAAVPLTFLALIARFAFRAGLYDHSSRRGRHAGAVAGGRHAGAVAGVAASGLPAVIGASKVPVPRLIGVRGRAAIVRPRGCRGFTDGTRCPGLCGPGPILLA
jgi:hypothetical protein